MDDLPKVRFFSRGKPIRFYARRKTPAERKPGLLKEIAFWLTLFGYFGIILSLLAGG